MFRPSYVNDALLLKIETVYIIERNQEEL